MIRDRDSKFLAHPDPAEHDFDTRICENAPATLGSWHQSADQSSARALAHRVHRHHPDARTFMTDFVVWYNEAHRHAGIGLHTPAEVHYGRHHVVRAVRQQTLAAARAAHPERFSTDRPLPKILDLPDEVWINNPGQQPKPEPQAA